MSYPNSVPCSAFLTKELHKNPAKPLQDSDESTQLRVDRICQKKHNLPGGDRVSSFLIKDILDEKKHGSDVTFMNSYANDDCPLQEERIRSTNFEEQELNERTPSVSCDSDSQRGECALFIYLFDYY